MIDLVKERVATEYNNVKIKPHESEYDIIINNEYYGLSFRDGSLGDFETFYTLLKSEIEHCINIASKTYPVAEKADREKIQYAYNERRRLKEDEKIKQEAKNKERKYGRTRKSFTRSGTRNKARS